MRRGTVGLLGDNPPSLLVSFRKSCVCQPTFLRLTLRHLESLGFTVPSECYTAQYGVYHGDRVSVGRGSRRSALSMLALLFSWTTTSTLAGNSTLPLTWSP